MTLYPADLASKLAVSAAGNTSLYVGAVLLRQHVLTAPALVHALALGVLLGATVGIQGWGLCVLLFGVGSGLTRVGRARKEAMGIAEARGGARKPAQVWGAAGAAAISATASCAAALMGFSTAEHALRIAYASAVAAKMADTAASEVGKAYGKKAFLVTTLKEVKPGTDGAVSIVGTMAGVLAATVAACYAIFTQFLDVQPALIVITAATIAFMAESFVGALWQKSYNMSNELVNFIQTAFAACLGAAMLVAFS